MGTLTQYLIEKSGHTIAVELDPRMVKVLNERFKTNILLEKNLEVINKDILKVDLKSLISNAKEKYGLENVKVIANLPYYITTPIITKLIEEKSGIDKIIVMVQKEVAQRLTEKPGQKETGTITYLIDYLTKTRKIVDVPNTAFIPAPKVDSQVIEFELRKEPKIKTESESILFKIIKVSFLQRRKTLVNNLVSSNVFENKEQAIKALEEINLDKNIRPENLTLEDYNNLTKKYLESFKN